jgi:hypothetical protein
VAALARAARRGVGAKECPVCHTRDAEPHLAGLTCALPLRDAAISATTARSTPYTRQGIRHHSFCIHTGCKVTGGHHGQTNLAFERVPANNTASVCPLAPCPANTIITSVLIVLLPSSAELPAVLGVSHTLLVHVLLFQQDRGEANHGPDKTRLHPPLNGSGRRD